MCTALDVAKVFIKKGLDTNRNKFDGNMKLQKLLFFANLISLSEKGKPLFEDSFNAFSNGCVIESIRLRYRNDCANLCADSSVFEPNFSQDEYDVVNLTVELFGDLSARELSEINHTFDFWNNAYKRSLQADGYKNKDSSLITLDEMLSEVKKMKYVIEQFKNTAYERMCEEVVNGIKFYYSTDFEMTDEVLEQLVEFSREAEDSSYSVYFEEGNLVIY